MSSIDLTPYRAAIRERICSFCLDRRHDGECNRPASDPCALETHLDVLVERVLAVGGSPDITDYVKSLRVSLCPTCRQDEDTGECPLRSLAECALDAYVLPVVEVIEEVAARQGQT